MRGRECQGDILADPVNAGKFGRTYPAVTASLGSRATHKASGFTGVFARFERDGVVLKGATGLERFFRLMPGAFVVAGRTVTLIGPKPSRPSAPAHTASGSLAVAPQRARLARASRILVEGIHDAELVERVWGDDLRIEGVVVERLDGLNHLAAVVAEFGPSRERRLGVLVDHLIPGTKEARLVTAIKNNHVLVTGTPFIDVWMAVKPSVVGIPVWPEVPRGIDWKSGACKKLGVADPAMMWRRILASVNSYVDLEPELVGAMEQLIDFVTEPLGASG